MQLLINMEIKEYIRLIFFLFLAITYILLVAQLINPNFFIPGKNIIFLLTLVFGILSFIFYFQDLLRFLKNLFGLGYKGWKGYKGYKKYRSKKIGKNWFDKIRKILLVSTKNILTIIAIFSYIYFLFWLYPKLTFDEFAFFLLLLYIPFSLKLKLDERYPIVFAIFLLVLSAITLAQGFEERANRIAIYAYYFLVIGVILMLAEYLREPKNNSSIALL